MYHYGASANTAREPFIDAITKYRVKHIMVSLCCLLKHFKELTIDTITTPIPTTERELTTDIITKYKVQNGL